MWFSKKNEPFAIKKSELLFHKERIALVFEKVKRAISSTVALFKRATRVKERRAKEWIPNPSHQCFFFYFQVFKHINCALVQGWEFAYRFFKIIICFLWAKERKCDLLIFWVNHTFTLFKEQREWIAHSHSFVMSDLSESLK